MKLLIRHIILLIIFMGHINYSWAQYDGLDSSHTVVRKAKSAEDPYRDKPKSYVVTRGLETMFNLSNASTLIEAAPYYGLWFKDLLTVAGGIHGSAGLSSYTGATTSIGVQTFARININNFFLQTEYRYSNMSSGLTVSDRQWVGSPIILLGLSYDADFTAWGSFGLITNYKMAERSPFGAFVFRFGFTF